MDMKQIEQMQKELSDLTEQQREEKEYVLSEMWIEQMEQRLDQNIKVGE